MSQDKELEDATVVMRKDGRRADAEPITPGTPSLAAGSLSKTSLLLGTTAGTTVTTPYETMHLDEIMRLRKFLIVTVVLGFGTAVLVAILGGHPVLRNILFACIGISTLSSAIFLLYIRDDRRYSPNKALIPASCAVAAAVVATHFFGVFSAAEMVFVLGIYFFSLSSSPLAAFLCYLATAVVQGAGMLLVLLRVLPDVGLVRADHLADWQVGIICALVEMVLLTTYLFARMSRRTTLLAVGGLEQALRQVSQRDALLREANQDLDRAQQGNQNGRLTGEHIGNWKVLDVIGRGAMGEVYEARHTEQDRLAAIKVLFPQVQSNPAQLKRFFREASIMAELQSPHIVEVFEVGDDPTTLPYIAMERLEGHDLGWYLRKRRRLSQRATAQLVSEVAAALEKARSADIVHRDIKPQNVFWAESEKRKRTWKVLDFGISKIGKIAGTLTRGNAVGTPGYMSPEQAHGGDVDHRADIFALSVIAYRALTGRVPFTGEDYPKVMFQLVYMQPIRPGEILQTLHADVDAALAIGLAKKPKDRYATALQFSEALDAAIKGLLSDQQRERAAKIIARAPWGGKAE